ncbi:MAG: SDR family oxidoreductase, partial [Pseudobdellovibrionaceae bacterium]
VLVCGASQGIGFASAVELAKLGAECVLLARNAEKLEEAKRELDKLSAGAQHKVIVCDLNDRKQLRSSIEAEVKSRPIEILIHNSGGPKGGPLLEASETEFLSGFENHILSAQLLAQVLVPGMKHQNYGRIINIVSTSVKAPIPGLGVSNTIRGAMGSFAKTLAGELGPFAITVNNVLPGYTKTERLEALKKAAATKNSKSESDIENLWKSATPLGRFAEAHEVGAAVAFLASPAAAFITGINLPVDGGRTPTL